MRIAMRLFLRFERTEGTVDPPKSDKTGLCAAKANAVNSDKKTKRNFVKDFSFGGKNPKSVAGFGIILACEPPFRAVIREGEKPKKQHTDAKKRISLRRHARREGFLDVLELNRS